MNIDWDIVVNVAVPFAALVMGHFLDRWFARRPKLISYLGHVSSFSLNDEKRTQVFTHAIVVRNTGRESANNVRIGHHVLPNYQLAPSVPHSVENIPTGGAEIVFPKLVPGEQVTISYLYFPPLTWDRINSYAKSDEGFAKVLNVIPTPQPSKLVSAAFWSLVFVGAVSLVYLAVEAIRWFLA